VKWGKWIIIAVIFYLIYKNAAGAGAFVNNSLHAFFTFIGSIHL
jgi:hypothetical protein